MMKKVMLLALTGTVLAGCQNTNTVEGAQSYGVCHYPDAPTIEAPGWVCDVMPKDLAIGAVGYAKKSAAGIGAMKTVALNNGRVTLATSFEVEVNNLFKQAIESTLISVTDKQQKEEVVESFQNVTKNVVTRTLTNSRIIVSQVSPNGGLYVLVGMDQPTYDANVSKVVDSAASDSKLWKQFNRDQAKDELNQALNSLKL